MTMIPTPLTTRKPFPIDGDPPAYLRLFQAARSAIAAYAAYRAMRRAEGELMALDDRTLKDIGLVRAQIQSALTDRRQHREGVVRLHVHRF